MTNIILLSIFILNVFAYNDIKTYIEERKTKEKEKENILRKGLM